jgi:riboflavin synthase
MFTGIIECLGKIEEIQIDSNNRNFKITSSISDQLKVDQSVSHNGVCLTVTKVENQSHWVTAILETLTKTDLGNWKIGDEINLERCLKIGDRLDGHWVQGHVDTVGECTGITNQQGSWLIEFSYQNQEDFKTVPKGSITVNGISLTVVDSSQGNFSVAIIPYTFEHTSMKNIFVGAKVNLEFDVIGKWVKAWMK